MLRLNKYKKYLPVYYKLLNDALFILIAFFFFVILAEGLLSGIISRYVSIYWFALMILLDILLIAIVGKKAEIKESKMLNKKTIKIILIVSGILLFNSVLKFNLILALVITLLAVASIYLIGKVLEED